MRSLLIWKYQFLFSVITMILGGLLYPLPKPLFDTPFATVVESSGGKLLSARIASDEQWRFPESTNLPEKFVDCLLTYEDRYFYYHPGVNPISLIRALRQNITAGQIVSGGSTLTMQLARLIRGNQPRNLYNKIIELWLSFRLEFQYSKKEILNLYASHAPFGGNVIGLRAASWRYFQRDPSNLSWAETATLAVLPNAPGLVFPGSFDAQLKDKRDRLLKLMHERGLLSRSEYNLSLAESTPPKPKQLPNLAGHLLQRIDREKGRGHSFRTSLDYYQQNTVNQLVQDYHSQYRFKEIHNTAAIVIEVETGRVRSYVGNTGNRFEGKHGQDVDIISSRRSPGSLLKPVLYALAVDEGLIAPRQLLPDIPLYFQGFAPQNFDRKFTGTTHADLALQSSLNVPFVHLLKDYGYEKLHQKLRSMGLESLDKSAGHYGLTMVLGGAETTLWELTGLYASLARVLNRFNSSGGESKYNRADYHANRYLELDSTSGISQENSGILSAAAIWHTFEAMRELRRPGESVNWKRFSSSKDIAWKTGTSYGHKDAWAIGLDSKYIVGVWMGNADGEGRPDLVGVTVAAPLMFRIFDSLGEGAFFVEPMSELEDIAICQHSGYRASSICTDVEYELTYYSAHSAPACTYHKSIHLDEALQWQVNSSCYPVNKMIDHPWFILPPAQAWYFSKTNQYYNPPPDFMESCTITKNQDIEMIYPLRNAKVYVPIEVDGQPGRVVFEAAHSDPDSPIFWHLNNQYIGTTNSQHQMGLYPPNGKHLLSLVDDQGRELNIPFEVLN